MEGKIWDTGGGGHFAATAAAVALRPMHFRQQTNRHTNRTLPLRKPPCGVDGLTF